MNVLRAAFGGDEGEEIDYSETIRRQVRMARKRVGKPPAEWAAHLQPQVRCGKVTPEAVECYEAGRNVPGADYYLAAVTAAGLPIHHIVDLWLDPGTNGMIRRLIMLLLEHGRV